MTTFEAHVFCGGCGHLNTVNAEELEHSINCTHCCELLDEEERIASIGQILALVVHTLEKGAETKNPKIDDSAYLRELAQRIFENCTPANSGLDQGDSDRLQEIAQRLREGEKR